MDQPLLRLLEVSRTFEAGSDSVTALRDISLSIHAGEFVAIVGTSGSGKSTLMNVLGCMDRPTQGSYLIGGQATDSMTADQLAELRNRHFGFVFQRYLLLAGLNALQNVEMPAVYGAERPSTRRERAMALLQAVGLSERRGHLPNQLSGGQQQRVAVARALMNGAQVILADEPTGALDSNSAHEVLRLLHRLHQQGRTVIVVTHDLAVASHAERIIEFSEGCVVADRRNDKVSSVEEPGELPVQAGQPGMRGWGYWAEMLRLAWQEVLVHKLRTGLTVLGIAIGVSVVLCVQALLEGGQEKVMRELQAMARRSLQIMPGAGLGDQRAKAAMPLSPEDASALKALPFVDGVTPVVTQGVTLQVGAKTVSVQLSGVGQDYFRVFPMRIIEGRTFTADDVERSAADVVIDQATRMRMLPDEPNPIGKTILLGRLPARITGVAIALDGSDASNLKVYVPYTTVMNRIARQPPEMLALKVAEHMPTDAAERAVDAVLAQRRGARDFFIQNVDRMREAQERSQRVFGVLAVSIALASLIVAGIGVTNIMLMSVAQRGREIGIRMAVGARPGDIGLQFIIEATLMCLLGAAAGVLLARGAGVVFVSLVDEFPMLFSATATAFAFVVPLVLGLVFGFVPAQRAARLDPVEALARE